MRHLSKLFLTFAIGSFLTLGTAVAQPAKTDKKVATTDKPDLDALGPGQVFGEVAILSSGRRTASVVATSPMRLIGFFKRDVWALEQRAPEAAERLRTLVAERSAALEAD